MVQGGVLLNSIRGNIYGAGNVAGFVPCLQIEYTIQINKTGGESYGRRKL